MSEQARTWALRLLALGIAIGIWFNASVEDRLVPSERVVEASVSFNRPRGYIVIDPVQSVNVRLLGSKKAVRQLSPFEVSVSVDLTARQEGSVTINLGPDNVLAPNGLEVAAIEPSTIRVDLEREVSQRLPVVPKLAGRPAAGVTIGEPEVFPNQVLVSGPASRIDRILSLSTPPIRLDGHASTFEETVAVMQPDPLVQVVQPSRVTVRVLLQPPPEERQATDSKPPRKEES
jgi:YbbR domain-containing protein